MLFLGHILAGDKELDVRSRAVRQTAIHAPVSMNVQVVVGALGVKPVAVLVAGVQAKRKPATESRNTADIQNMRRCPFLDVRISLGIRNRLKRVVGINGMPGVPSVSPLGLRA